MTQADPLQLLMWCIGVISFKLRHYNVDSISPCVGGGAWPVHGYIWTLPLAWWAHPGY